MTGCAEICCTTETELTWALDLDDTLAVLERHAQAPESRFRVGSPCRWVRPIDVFVHVVLPEWLERYAPRLARSLRDTSPRWGRSWQHCRRAHSKPVT